MSEELKQQVRDAVRSEIVRQVNTPPETNKPVEEGFKANSLRAVVGTAAFLSVIGGTFAAVGSMNPGILFGAMAGSAAAMGVAEVAARKIAHSEFENLFNELQRAVAARDKFIEQAQEQGSPEEAEMFLERHKAEMSKLTKQQRKIAGKMRKVLGTEKTSKDTSRILNSLTSRDRRYIEELVEKAESGLVTMVNV